MTKQTELDRVEGEVIPLIKKLYRASQSSWAGGEDTITIEFNRTPYAEGGSTRVWSENGKWSGTNSYKTIHLQPGWRKHIGSVPGLANAGDMFTTHAKQVSNDCWQACWVVQSVGFSLRIESGFIVKIGDDFYHGKTERHARAVAQRKVKEKGIEDKLATLSPEALIWEFGEVKVTKRDSIFSGNCESGTDNWAQKHFPDRDWATVQEILIADSSERVVRACKAAIRRATKKSLALAARA